MPGAHQPPEIHRTSPGHPDDQPRAASTSAPALAWTAEDCAAVGAVVDAGDLPAQVVCPSGRTVFVCEDESAAITSRDTAMQQMLRDLVRAGRQDDPVQISDPKNPAEPTLHTTVGALAAVPVTSAHA